MCLALFKPWLCGWTHLFSPEDESHWQVLDCRECWHRRSRPPQDKWFDFSSETWLRFSLLSICSCGLRLCRCIVPNPHYTVLYIQASFQNVFCSHWEKKDWVSSEQTVNKNKNLNFECAVSVTPVMLCKKEFLELPAAVEYKKTIRHSYKTLGKLWTNKQVNLSKVGWKISWLKCCQFRWS